MYYKITLEKTEAGKLLRLAFGEPSSNGPKVRDVIQQLQLLDVGGPLFINGPASVPVAMAIAHGVAHRFDPIWVYDPKEDHYVCVISHAGPEPGTEMKEGPR